MKYTPPISCMCLTYGRPHLLAEAIESFLRQDYKGEKELLILNDLPDQTLSCNAPGVRIVNVSKRFKTVGEKRNAAAALSTHDVLAVWDDDDIYLPHRLSYSIDMMEETKRYFKPSKAFTLSDGKIISIKANLFHSSGIWFRSLFDDVRGYAHMGSGQDHEIEVRFEQLLAGKKNYDKIKPEELFYIYRWSGTDSYHLSGFGQDKQGKTTGNTKVEEYVRKRIAEGRIQTGIVTVDPKWEADYVNMARDFISACPG